jgi:hypothetical protein
MIRQPPSRFAPRVETLEERCTPSVVPQLGANTVLVTTGSSHIAIHEMAAGGKSLLMVSGAGRSSDG